MPGTIGVEAEACHESSWRLYVTRVTTVVGNKNGNEDTKMKTYKPTQAGYRR
jgi:hypothetical protein